MSEFSIVPAPFKQSQEMIRIVCSLLEKKMADKSPKQNSTTDKNIQTQVYYNCLDVVVHQAIDPI